MLSFSENVSSKLKSWKTKPRLFLRYMASCFSGMLLISTPESRTSPAVGLSSVARMFRSVVFPEPLSPMIATNSPSSTEKFTSESACTCVPPNLVVYIFFKCETFNNSISSPPAIFYCVLSYLRTALYLILHHPHDRFRFSFLTSVIVWCQGQKV